MPVVSGEKLLVQQADSGATVTIGNQTVRILRSDIVLENGVMHVSDGGDKGTRRLIIDCRGSLGRSEGRCDGNEERDT